MVDSEYVIRQAFDRSPDEGLALLFRRYHQPLCSHAVRFLASRALAEDIVSDIFYEFYARQLYCTVTTSYRAFLFAAVRNRAFDHMRAEVRRGTASLEDSEWLALRPDEQPDQLTQFEEMYHDVEAAVQELPARRRQVYLMNRFEGKKHAEIAEELGLSVRTVNVQLYRAIHQMRAVLAKKWSLILILLSIQA